MSPWKWEKIKVIPGSNPQKAQLGVVVIMFTQFGDPSMCSLGDLLRTRCLSYVHSLSYIFMKNEKNKNHTWVSPPKGTSRGHSYYVY